MSRPVEAEFTGETKRLVIERCGSLCEECGAGGPLTIHHLLPIWIATNCYQSLPHAALRHIANSKVLCRSCHEKEHEKDWYTRDYTGIALVLFGLWNLPFQEPLCPKDPDQPSHLPKRKVHKKKWKKY